MWPCVSSLRLLLLIRPRARARETSLCQQEADVTSPPLPLSLSFSDPAAASPLRLPARPAVHVTPRLLPFASASSLAPCPLPTSPRNLAAHLLVARPLAGFPVSAFFILRAGAGGGERFLFLDQGKGEGKNGLYFCDRRLACRSLAHTQAVHPSLLGVCVWPSVIAELEPLVLGVPDHFEEGIGGKGDRRLSWLVLIALFELFRTYWAHDFLALSPFLRLKEI